jgi:hypothetical protein
MRKLPVKNKSAFFFRFYHGELKNTKYWSRASYKAYLFEAELRARHGQGAHGQAGLDVFDSL